MPPKKAKKNLSPGSQNLEAVGTRFNFFVPLIRNLVVLFLFLSCTLAPLSACTFDSSGFSNKNNENKNFNNTCGDGVIADEEECDDENSRNGDGCTGECLIETGWSCTGEPSDCSTVCGDGLIYGSEACDDGNTAPEDGCDATCQIEPGYTCTGQPSVCTNSNCGDGQIEGNEECDDGNTTSNDGCTSDCNEEIGWDCTGQPSVCQTFCGDGIIRGTEECDDDNSLAGDGCSSYCQVEPGYICEGEPSACETGCGDGFVTQDEQCDDGNNAPNDGCSPVCQVEVGWECNANPSICQTICGDGLIRGTEQCDDGNNLNTDGCSSTCAVESHFLCNGEPSACSCVVFVNNNNSPTTPNGLSWSTAYTTVQEGIDDAAILASTNADTCEVWVAGGTYRIFKTLHTDTVTLATNVHLYGGFAGTETARNQRDWELNETTLNGATSMLPANNVYHVVTANNVDNTILDGFTIKNGIAAGGRDGGGLRSTGSNIIAENCIFEENEARDGGAAYISGGSAHFLSCDFRDNEAFQHGGGIRSHSTDLFLSDCSFASNSASERGGGMYTYSSSVDMSECIFGPNNHADRGGAICTAGSGNIFVSNSTFKQNSSDSFGGAIAIFDTANIENSLFYENQSHLGAAVYFGINSFSSIANSLLVSNDATSNSGGIRAYNCVSIIANCIIWFNNPNQITASSTPETTVRYSNIQDGFEGEGNIDANPLFIDPEGGNFRLQSGSPCIDAADGEVAPEFDMDGNPRIDDTNTPNTGTGNPPYADIGPYEYQP